MKLRDLLLIVFAVVAVGALVVMFLRKATPTVIKTKSDNPWVAAIDAIPDLVNAFTHQSERLPSTTDLDALGLESML